MGNEYKSSGVKSAGYDSNGSSAGYGAVPALNRRAYSGNGLGNSPMERYGGMNIIAIIYLQDDKGNGYFIPIMGLRGLSLPVNSYGALGDGQMRRDIQKYSADAKKAQPVRGRPSGLETDKKK